MSAYPAEYILWEKLTALHQFCTKDNPPNPDRLARHWYDVDCSLSIQFADPLNSNTARNDVIEMKKHRWASANVLSLSSPHKKARRTQREIQSSLLVFC